jgi:hypothetical protein
VEISLKIVRMLTYSSIGKSKRSQNISSARTPGPGAYNPESSFTKSARTSSRCAFSKSARVFDVFQGKRTAGRNIFLI